MTPNAGSSADNAAERSVAVVIPTHRRPAMLLQAVESVLSQHPAPSEVVVVDDAEDQATAAALQPLANEVRLLVGHQPGVSSSRNQGAAATSAALLAFLDDDDLWQPGYLAAATEAIGSADAVVTAAVQFRGQDGQDQDAYTPRIVPAGLEHGDIVVFNPGITGSNLLVRRDVFERVGGFDEALWYGEDKDLFVRLLRSGITYATVRTPLVRRRLHDTPRLTTGTGRRIAMMEYYLDKHAAEMSRGQRRQFRGLIERVRLRTLHGPSRHLQALRVLALLGPGGLHRARSGH